MANNSNLNKKPNFHHHHYQIHHNQNQNQNYNNNNQTGPNFDIQNLLKPSLPSPPTFPVPAPPPSSSPLPITSSPCPRPIPGGGGGARLMALLPPPMDSACPVRVPSRKTPRGRHLIGERTVYDVDVRLPGEAQPQLEVTPITKYASDPKLLRGRQIAVNRSYICYGLKPGAIRVLDINTALRALLRGHTQRVTDMAFFAEDVQLLASASVDGLVFIWKIVKGKDESDTLQIAGKIVLALQIVGLGTSVHPRLSWHPHKQEILVVAIGNCILKIDTLRVGRGKKFTALEPLQCPIDKLIDGVVLVGKHDGEITELSMSQWMVTRLASASMDGVVKIWLDRKASPVSVFQPHDGHPVNSLTFFTSPHSPEHIVLITAGPLNREVKLWTSTNEEGWLLPSDTESWLCTETLEITSSAEPNPEEAFFNQVFALPRAGIFLLANAKKNAIYVVHIEYGQNPAATRMDYIAEFTVTIPILSLTGTSDVFPNGDHVIQIYCVQTQAIQQYALDLSQCIPLPIENLELEKAKAAASKPVDLVTHMPYTSPESSSSTSRIATISSDIPSSAEVSSSGVDLSNRSEASLTPSDQVGGQQMNFVKNNVADAPPTSDNLRKIEKEAFSITAPGLVAFKHPTHLITPSEILSTTVPSSESSSLDAKFQNIVTSNDAAVVQVEVENTGEIGTCKNDEDVYTEPQIVPQKKERAFFSQASGLSFGKYSAVDALEQPSNTTIEEVQDTTKDVPAKADESEAVLSTPVQATKGKKQKGKSSGPSSSSPSPFNSTGSSNEPDGSLVYASADATLPQLSSMKAKLDQVISAQIELQKQMSLLVSGPVTKEGKRLEGVFGRTVEKVVKANSDALWNRFQEENAKQEKLEQDRTQQLADLVANCISRELPTVLEKTVKKEIAVIGPVIARSMTQIMEKSVSGAISDAFQKEVGEKAVAQLEKSVGSKLEATMATHIQLQFQTSGKQALQDALKTSLEASIIPAFEVACKNMFEQVDSAFKKGFVKHSTAAQHQFESTHSPLAVALREAINSASTVTRTLSGELADGQRKLLALAAAGASSKSGTPLLSQLSNGSLGSLQEMAEAPVDPLKELSRLIAERKFEEAFTGALQKSDVSIVSWLCSQVDLQGILSLVPIPLNQGVLLALLQQLACDISNDTSRKLGWMTDVAVAINPTDPLITIHVRPIFEQVYQILTHQRNLPSTTASDANSIRLLLHVINSVLMSCK